RLHRRRDLRRRKRVGLAGCRRRRRWCGACCAACSGCIHPGRRGFAPAFRSRACRQRAMGPRWTEERTILPERQLARRMRVSGWIWAMTIPQVDGAKPPRSKAVAIALTLLKIGFGCDRTERGQDLRKSEDGV